MRFMNEIHFQSKALDFRRENAIQETCFTFSTHLETFFWVVEWRYCWDFLKIAQKCKYLDISILCKSALDIYSLYVLCTCVHFEWNFDSNLQCHVLQTNMLKLNRSRCKDNRLRNGSKKLITKMGHLVWNQKHFLLSSKICVGFKFECN